MGEFCCDGQGFSRSLMSVNLVKAPYQPPRYNRPNPTKKNKKKIIQIHSSDQYLIYHQSALIKKREGIMRCLLSGNDFSGPGSPGFGGWVQRGSTLSEAWHDLTLNFGTNQPKLTYWKIFTMPR